VPPTKLIPMPSLLPEMCKTCQLFNILQICRDYQIPLAYTYDQPNWDPWVKQPNGDYTKTCSYTIKPDFSKWDGKTGL